MIRFLTVMLLLCAAWLPLQAKASQRCQQVQVGVQTVGQYPNQMQQPILENQCVWLSGAAGVNPSTRQFYAYWNYPDNASASEKLEVDCGRGVCTWVAFQEDFAWIAMTEDDSFSVSGTNSPRAVLDQCNRQKPTKADCYVVLAASSTGNAAYWYFGAISYDPKTGKGGFSWNAARAWNARESAQSFCDNTETCWAYAFQLPYGAIAAHKSGRLFGAESGRSEVDARKRAKKYCEEEMGKGEVCEAVISGRSNRPPTDKPKGFFHRMLLGD